MHDGEGRRNAGHDGMIQFALEPDDASTENELSTGLLEAAMRTAAITSSNAQHEARERGCLPVGVVDVTLVVCST